MIPTYQIALAGASLFVLLLVVLHFLKPEFDPGWRMISEYAIGRFGWLMRLAFFSWAAAVLALTLGLRGEVGVVPKIWLYVVVAALVGAGVFRTDPITEQGKDLANRIHALCGAIVILSFPLLATFLCVALCGGHTDRNPILLILLTGLNWVGLLAFIASVLVARRKSSNVEGFGPEVRLGWPNRLLVVSYAGWVVAAAAMARPS